MNLALSGRYWALCFIVAVVGLATLEVAFRSDVIWRLPLGVTMTAANDINSKGVWQSFQPPSKADRRVLLVGASTALASMQLPNDGTSRLISERAASPIEFRILCSGGATFAEYLAFVENALAHDYKPDLVVAYAAPSMLTQQAADKAKQEARFVPLISEAWLDAREQRERSDWSERAYYWALRHSTVVRHRYYINNWIRRRFSRVLRRDFRWAMPVNETRYRNAFDGALEEDTDRIADVKSIPTRFQPELRVDTGLTTLLDFLQRKHIPVLILEAPRSPVVRSTFASIKDAHATMMKQSAREYGATYFDPNEDVSLAATDFADLYHMSWPGRDRWLDIVLPTIIKMIS